MKHNLANFKTVFISISSLFLLAPEAKSEIIPDNTLGQESSRVRNVQITPPGSNTPINSDLIEDGARRGSNLFHSFSQFNIDAGGRAFFDNPPGVTNILTRVTGGNPSNILGTLGVLGDANLYLINPNGIFFGNGANLDIRGSFTATTADRINLGATGSFSAVDPASDNLLSVKPEVFFHNAVRPPGTGNIELNGAQLTAPGGININTTGNLNITNGSDISTRTSSNVNGGDINIKAGNIWINGGRSEDLTGIAGGKIDITTPGLLEISNGGQISATTFGDGNAGSLSINAGNIRIGGTFTTPTGILAQVQVGAKGAGGKIDITTPGLLEISNRGQIAASTFGEGNAGSLSINAGNIKLDRVGAISARVNPGAKGAGGKIDITTPGLLEISNGGQIDASTDGEGNAGTLTVNARNILIEGTFTIPNDTLVGSGLFAQVNSGGAKGAGGNLNITTTGNLEIINGGSISATTLGKGSAGILTVNAGNIKIDGGRILAQVNPGATGRGGNLNITTPGLLEIINGGSISASTFSSGDAGNLTINAGNIKLNGGGGILARVRQNQSGETFRTTGMGGNINIVTTGLLEILNGGSISASTNSVGDAGSLTVNAGNIKIDGGRILAQVSRGATGTGGTLNITTPGNLEILNGGEISANTFSEGNAGSLTVNAGNIKIDSGTSTIFTGITAQVTRGATGAGGNLNITTPGNLEIINGGVISASTFSEGNAGSLTVNAGNIKIDSGTSTIFTGITAQVSRGATGTGGTLNITTPGNLEILNGGVISASTFSEGNAGSLTVNAGNIKIDRGTSTIFTGIAAQVDQGATGAGGNLNITTTGNLEIINGGVISASTFSSGNAGSLTVNAGNIKIDRGTSTRSTGIFAQVNRQQTTGRGGNLNITTLGLLEILNGGEISTETNGVGNGGNARINGLNILIRDGGKISATGTETATGNSGSIIISNADRITIQNNGSIEASNLGTGEGGEIDIRANSLDLNRGFINAGSNSATGGNIDIALQEILTLRNASEISATAGNRGGAGAGGNINIDVPLIFAFPRNNKITADAFAGAGGNINISTNNIFGYPQFLTITASSNLGIDGNVNILGINDEISQGSIGLPETPVDAQDIIARDVCRVENDRIAGGSSFTIAIRFHS